MTCFWGTSGVHYRPMVLKPTDMLKAKDSSIKFRCPVVVRKALDIAAKRHGNITSSKLSLFILVQFLSMSVPMQKRMLRGEFKAGVTNSKITTVRGRKEGK